MATFGKIREIVEIFCGRSVLNGWLFRLKRCLGIHTYSLHDLSDSLDASQITYSQVWEDTRPLRQALLIQSGENVMCIASGGDNAFSLLLDDPSSVLAVDYSPAQIHLCKLKQAAIKHLTYPQFICLLGLGPDSVDGVDRNWIYRELMREKLGEDERNFWDECSQQDSIRNGLLHCGIYEQYFRVFAKLIRPLVHDDATTAAFLSIRDPKLQKEFYDKILDTLLWRVMVRLYMGDVLIGRCPPFYERSDINIGEHFLQRLTHTMRDIPVADNFYLEYILTGELSGLTSLPDYLQEENFIVLQERIDRLQFVQGDVLKHMEILSVQGLHVADLSNIFDFVPEEQHNHYREAVMSHVAPGGRICHWTFVPMSKERLQQVNVPFSADSFINEQLCESFNLQERAWFYQTFIVQHVLPVKKNGHINGFVKSKPQISNGGLKHSAGSNKDSEEGITKIKNGYKHPMASANEHIRNGVHANGRA